MPSYAQPTKASERRRLLNSTLKEAKTTKPDRRSFTTADCGAYDLHLVHPYAFTTASSRRKARYPRRFDLFALPPELRNRVYEYVKFEEQHRLIDLWHTKPDKLHTALPPLLAANKQVLSEAGGYFFSKGQITCLLSSYEPMRLLAWLRLIGRRNRSCLSRLVISFALEREESTSGERCYNSVISRFMRLADAAHLVGMGEIFEGLATKNSALHAWRCQAQQKYDDHWGDEVRYTRHDSWEVIPRSIPLSSFDRLRNVLKLLFEFIGQCPVDSASAKSNNVSKEDMERVPAPWSIAGLPWDPVQHTHKVTTKSGEVIYVDIDR